MIEESCGPLAASLGLAYATLKETNRYDTNEKVYQISDRQLRMLT